jgi:hypothetical protein
MSDSCGKKMVLEEKGWGRLRPQANPVISGPEGNPDGVRRAATFRMSSLYSTIYRG